MTDRVELLAPAKDAETGMAAINCGADAVYIGGPGFSARAAAGNQLADIERLAAYAHRYWARVYAAVNTILRDEELDPALTLIRALDEAGVDALIIQDVGLLECALPALPLIASTQMHNHSPERVAFLEKVGFTRAILARELDIERIMAIRKACSIELEVFVHGALCVSYSGQCYLSHALGGRSGNRGQCAQPCRRSYTLEDDRGNVLAGPAHLLSLKDLNLSAHLDRLIEAGIHSFKIEGRLKDRQYVMNTVAFYRKALDEILAKKGLGRSSSGSTELDFEPDPERTFNRGFTTYFLLGRDPSGVSSMDTPKSKGKPVGRVLGSGPGWLELEEATELHPGDGVCAIGDDLLGAHGQRSETSSDRPRRIQGMDLLGAHGQRSETSSDRPRRIQGMDLLGAHINRVEGKRVLLSSPIAITPGAVLHRNLDHAFDGRLRASRSRRRIPVTLRLTGGQDRVVLTALDDDGNQASAHLDGPFEEALQASEAHRTMVKQLSKTGGTDFSCAALEVEPDRPVFVSVSRLNDLRRRTLERLAEVRALERPIHRIHIVPNEVPFPQSRLSYNANVLNAHAERFYRRHGVSDIEPAAESGLDMRGRRLMTCRYCVLEALGLCVKKGGPGFARQPRQEEREGSSGAQPLLDEREEVTGTRALYLVDAEGRRIELEFDCEKCEMHLVG